MAAHLRTIATAAFRPQHLPLARLGAAAAGAAAASLMINRSSSDGKRSYHPPQLRSHQHAFAEQVEQPGVAEVLSSSPLTKEDELRVLAALEENVAEAMSWIERPPSWWLENKTVQVKGAGEITLRAKALPGYDSLLYMGQFIVPNATWDELKPLVELKEGCLKIEKDPVMKEAIKFKSFNRGHTDAQVETLRSPGMFRLHSFSNLLGIISPREVDEWTVQWRFKDGRIAESSCGLHSKRFAKHAEGSPSFKALLAAPVTNGYVRTCDHNSGLLIEPLDVEAISGRTGAWRLSYYALTDVNGKIPNWAAREGTKQTIVTYLNFVHRELVAGRSQS